MKIDPAVMEHVPNALEAITKSREMCKDLQHNIHSMNILFQPTANRRLEAQRYIDIKISAETMKRVEKELEY